MKIDYKKCHANAILIVCMCFVTKNIMVMDDAYQLKYLNFRSPPRSPHDVCNIWVLKSIPNMNII